MSASRISLAGSLGGLLAVIPLLALLRGQLLVLIISQADFWVSDILGGTSGLAVTAATTRVARVGGGGGPLSIGNPALLGLDGLVAGIKDNGMGLKLVKVIIPSESGHRSAGGHHLGHSGTGTSQAVDMGGHLRVGTEAGINGGDHPRVSIGLDITRITELSEVRHLVAEVSEEGNNT